MRRSRRCRWYRELFLRPGRKLSFEPETMGPEHAAPDGFFQAPLTVTDRVEIVSWSTEAFEEPTKLMGTGAFHLFASIDQPDTNWIVRLWDVAPSGKKQLLPTAYLKASMGELDEAESTLGSPVHPLTRKMPVEPGAIEEYVLRVYPMAATRSCRATRSPSSCPATSRWPMSTTPLLS